jgi:type IV fimbrial biogenesis protein FimT
MNFVTRCSRSPAQRAAAARLGNNARGYSLIEQISVISIAAILITVGVPSYRYVTNSNRVTAEVNGLLGDLQFARSQAATSGQAVTVCPSSDGQTCSASSQDWESGWIVFSDPNASATVGSTAAVLRVQPSFAATHDLFLAPSSLAAVTFNREGFAMNLPIAANGAVTLKLHTQPANTQWTRCLQINVVGQVTTERAGQGACS